MIDKDPVVITIPVIARSKFEKVLQKFRLLPLKRTFKIHHQVVSSNVKLSRLILSIDPGKLSSLESILKLIELRKDLMARIIATAVCNGGREPSSRLVKFFYRNLTPQDVNDVLQGVVAKMDTFAYLQAVVNLTGLNVLGGDAFEKPHMEIVPEATVENSGELP